MRPQHIVAERSGKSQADTHEHYQEIFAKFEPLSIQTSTKMVPQFHPWYLGMSHPFTLPVAVGGYDVPFHARWRRPENDDIAYPRAIFPRWLNGEHSEISTACEVKLFDITRGLPQRIEGQFRRHWGFAPALWNLYFRECVNLGASLKINRNIKASTPHDAVEQDAAQAAAGLVQILEKGSYTVNGKRRKINGDFSKLCMADNLTNL